MSLECIRDQESIAFDTTTGEWQGPLSWEIPSWSSQGGAGKIQVAANGGMAVITLAHPAISLDPPVVPEQTRSFSCGINVAFDPPATEISMKVKITDGTYSYEGEWYTCYNAQYWEFPGTLGDIPLDWANESTIFELSLLNNGATAAIVRIDEAHFYEEFGEIPPQPTSKPQYLPIMGIG